MATSDADGKIVLTDQRLFPHLYDDVLLLATDELGEQQGTITLTSEVRFYFYDPATESTWRFDRGITGSTSLAFTIGDPI